MNLYLSKRFVFSVSRKMVFSVIFARNFLKENINKVNKVIVENTLKTAKRAEHRPQQGL